MPPGFAVREGRQVGRPESGDPECFEIRIPFEGRGGNHETVFRKRPSKIAAVKKCALVLKKYFDLRRGIIYE